MHTPKHGGLIQQVNNQQGQRHRSFFFLVESHVLCSLVLANSKSTETSHLQRLAKWGIENYAVYATCENDVTERMVSHHWLEISATSKFELDDWAILICSTSTIDIKSPLYHKY